MSTEAYLKGQFAASVLRLAGAKEMSQLKRACSFPRVHQARTLRQILGNAKDTVYGKEHRFAEILAAKSDPELFALYRKYNPPTEYEYFRPYVDRMLHGEPDILFKGKPVLYATTSGSTGEPKYVPISKEYLDNAYGRMTRLWLSNYVGHRRSVFNGKIFVIIGKEIESYAPDGTVCGSISAFLQRTAPAFIRNLYAIPNAVYDIEDYGVRNYVLMRIGLEYDITLWIVPNPSTIVEMQNTVDKWLDDMISDIGNGTISDKFEIPEDIRKVLCALLKPNPKRAQELRSLQSKNERVLPRHYWPNLKVLSSWKCGNTQIYLRKMANFFDDSVYYQELGYFATECRAGLVFDENLDSVLMSGMHFFEFRKESELNDPDAPFYFIWELKEGERYCPYVTTWSGLYRYNMNDILQAGPNFYNTPKVHMAQKVNGIVSITGEKLYEGQFIKAVEDAQQSTGLKLSYYTGYVNLNESRYDWYFEFVDRKVNQKQADAFAKVVDENLKKLNIEYESKRNSFRLNDPEVFLLQQNTFDKFKEFVLSRTHRDASRFKPNVLAQNEEYHGIINKLVLDLKTARDNRKERKETRKANRKERKETRKAKRVEKKKK